MNFIRGEAGWSVSIGLLEQGVSRLGVLHQPLDEYTVAGGAGLGVTVNGVAAKPLRSADPSRLVLGIGLHPTISVKAKLTVLRFATEDLGASPRFCGSSTQSFLNILKGETDGYLALGDATWDVAAALPILQELGAINTVDWSGHDMQDKL